MANPVQLNALGILVESTQTDLHNIEGIQEHVVISSILESHKSIIRLDANLVYSEAMIPVIQVGSDYLVEHDMLIKLMESTKIIKGFCDEQMALKAVCEHNEISMERTYIVLESEESYRRTLQELDKKIKKAKDPKKKRKLQITLAGIQKKLTDLKENSDLNLLRKPNKCDVYVNESEDDYNDDDEYEDDEYFGDDENEDDDGDGEDFQDDFQEGKCEK